MVNKFLLIVLFLIFSLGVQAEDIQMSGIQATFSHHGYQVRFASSDMKGSLRTQIIYYKRPTVHIYQNRKKVMTLQSKVMKENRDTGDFIFEDQVRMKTKEGMLKTNFLKFNYKSNNFTSFDRYTFGNIRGRAFYGTVLPEVKMQLFNQRQL